VLGISFAVLYVADFFNYGAAGYTLRTIPILSRFVPALPYFGLILSVLGLWIFGNDSQISAEFTLLGELIIFAFGFYVSIFVYNDSLQVESVGSRILFFLVILGNSSFLKSKTKAILVSLVFSSVVSIIVSFLAYPFFKSSTGQAFIFFRFAPNIQIPYFYVSVFLAALVSLLFSYCWMSYLDSLSRTLFGRNLAYTSASKSFAIYIQIIPFALSPLAILQAFGKTEFLQTTTIFLFNFCLSQMMMFFVCMIFEIAGNRIFNMKNLGVTTLYSSIAFVGLVLVIFNFLVQNVDYGSFAFALIVCTMFASSLGVASARISSRA